MKTSSRHLLYRSLIACLLLGTTSIFSQAQILVGYNFAGNDGDQSTQAANTADSSAYSISALSASSLTLGSGYNTAGNGTGYAPNTFAFYTGNNYASSVSASIAGNKNLQFSVTSNAGTTLSLSSLSMGVFTQNGVVSTLGLAYSLDGGTNWSTTGIPGGDSGFPTASYTGGDQSPKNPSLITVDLSSISALQHVSGTVLIDLVDLNNGNYQSTFFATTSGGAATPSSLDDVTLGGTVISSVPEPSSVWLLLLGLCALGYHQRRKMAALV